MSVPPQDVEELVREIGMILHGKPPEVQSAALADLLAMWLAGHVVFHDDRKIDQKATREVRDDALATFIELVKELIPVNAKSIEKKLGTR
jgi:hypothetical protein